VILLDSLLDDALNAPQPEARLSLFILALLLSGWTALRVWQTKNVQRIPVLACLLPICVLSGVYVLHLEAVGYVLALTGIALLYVGINHATERLLVMLAPLSLKLDQIALVITALVPFISSPFLLLDLLSRAFSPQLFPASWQAIVELVAIALCLAITLDITFRRAGLSKIPAKSGWCWLLVYSGFLLVWKYSQIVLLLNFEPVWAFVGLTLVLIGVAVIVRRVDRGSVGQSARSAGRSCPGRDAYIKPASKSRYDQRVATRFCGYPLRGIALPATISVVVVATCRCTSAAFCIETGAYIAYAEIYQTTDDRCFRVAAACHRTTLQHHLSDTRPEHKHQRHRDYPRTPFLYSAPDCVASIRYRRFCASSL
jgi:hypothetical protein